MAFKLTFWQTNNVHEQTLYKMHLLGVGPEESFKSISSGSPRQTDTKMTSDVLQWTALVYYYAVLIASFA